jgi:hypothetical protein
MANHLYGSGWTEARENQLRDLWSTQLSAKEIAAVMGGFEHTPDNGRNAVLGKAYRMGLSAKAKPGAPAVKRHGDIDRERRRQEARFQRAPVCKVAKRAAPAAVAESLNIPFDDLRNFNSVDPNQCRFIDNDTHPFIACGAETPPGKSYCAHHHAITHSRRIAITESDRARRAAHATKVWFKTSIRLTGIPAEAAA